MLAYTDPIEADVRTGPRVYSTGPALFSFNEFTSEQQVLDVLSRYPDHYRTRNIKEYRTGNRRVREWVAEACNRLHLMPTTEGALDMKLDLTQIQDGFAGNEHALTAMALSNDVIQLVARTRVSYTPTLEISNSGLPAQNYFLSTASPHDDPKLNRFIPHYVIDEKTQRLKWARKQEYLYPRIAEGAAKIMRAGGLIGVGSHGEFEGLAYHWELEALAEGGLTPHEVLRAATIGSSEVIGRKDELGSLDPGKFADILVLDKNPLLDLKNTLSIREVMKNGRLYDAATLDELWPRHRPLPPLWFWNENPR
jgi:Amidohydrolase family